MPYSSCLISTSMVPAGTADVGQISSSSTDGTGPSTEPRSETSSISIRGRCI